VGDPSGAGQFEYQQGQQPADRGDDAGAGVAGPSDQVGQVQRGQVGQRQQQPGPGGVDPGGPGGRVQDPGGGQVGVPARGGRVDAGLGFGAAQQPAEALLGQDLGDRGAVQRGLLGGQPGGDLIAGQSLSAQRDDPAADPVLGRRGARRWAGFAGRGEQVQLPGPPLADQVDHRPPGVAETVRGLLVGQALDVPGADRLVPALVHLVGSGERLRPRPLR
jgi:hypothetical protein